MPIVGRYLAHINDVVRPAANDIADKHESEKSEQDADRNADADGHAEWFNHTDVRAARGKTVGGRARHVGYG